MTILDFQPRSIQVVLDEVTTSRSRSTSSSGPTPDGVDVGEVTYDADTRSPSRARAPAVSRVVSPPAVVATLDPEGIDFDRDVEARPVDDSGESWRAWSSTRGRST